MICKLDEKCEWSARENLVHFSFSSFYGEQGRKEREMKEKGKRNKRKENESQEEGVWFRWFLHLDQQERSWEKGRERMRREEKRFVQFL